MAGSRNGKAGANIAGRRLRCLLERIWCIVQRRYRLGFGFFRLATGPIRLEV
jgi:hypothetical protein